MLVILNRFSYQRKMETHIEKACRYYDDNYDLIFERMWQSNEKHKLNNANQNLCRFCGKIAPEVTFRTVAHAVPELLGNRGLTSSYECDTCNAFFGSTIETDLGEWSKPMRTLSQIRGKKGIPTLKTGPNNSSRIEAQKGNIKVKTYEEDPIHEIDEINNKIIFPLKRGSYTPVAVYKAFVKIGLTLIPENEMGPFKPALNWILDENHAQSWFHGMPIIHTFLSGPMPSDRLVTFILRRKSKVNSVPYCYLVFGYGNDIYQIMLPAPEKDAHLGDKELSLIPFPTPRGPDPMKYGAPTIKPLDMTGTTPVRGELVKIGMGYEKKTQHL